MDRASWLFPHNLAESSSDDPFYYPGSRDAFGLMEYVRSRVESHFGFNGDRFFDSRVRVVLPQQYVRDERGIIRDYALLTNHWWWRKCVNVEAISADETAIAYRLALSPAIPTIEITQIVRVDPEDEQLDEGDRFEAIPMRLEIHFSIDRIHPQVQARMMQRVYCITEKGEMRLDLNLSAI